MNRRLSQWVDNDSRPSRLAHPHHAFTLVEVLVVVAILALLAAILFPVFKSARDSARRTTCNSNLRQIGIALELYANDHNRRYPSTPPPQCTWSEGLVRYLKTSDILNCPSAPHLNYQPGCPVGAEVDGIYSGFDGAYTLNAGDLDTNGRLSQIRIRVPSQMILAVDGSGDLTQPGKGSGPISQERIIEMGVELRHKDGANALFADGHTKWLSPTAITQRSLWTLSGRDEN